LSSTSIASAVSSSFGTRTPEDLIYPHGYSHHDYGNADCHASKHVIVLPENETSVNSSDCPVFSSLEVELSGSIPCVAETRLSVADYSNIDLKPETPQRASVLPTTALSSESASEESLPSLPDIDLQHTHRNIEPNAREFWDSDFVSRIPRLRQDCLVSPTTTSREAAVPVTNARISQAKGPRDLKSSAISLLERINRCDNQFASLHTWKPTWLSLCHLDKREVKSCLTGIKSVARGQVLTNHIPSCMTRRIRAILVDP